MLSRRYLLTAILVVAVSAGATIIFAATSHSSRGASSAQHGSAIHAVVTGSPARASKGQLRAGLPHAEVPDGPAPPALLRPARPTDRPLKEEPELATDVRRIAIATHLGINHAVYVGKSSAGLTCVILQEEPSGRGGGGCNPSNGPFAGSTVLWSSVQYNEKPNKLVVFGTVTAKVASMSVVLGGGETTPVPLSDDGGFIYIVTKPSIEASDVPKSILTFDASGRQIENTPLGITFGP